MSRTPELRLEFAARYEVAVLDRIERSSELRRVVGFPGAYAVDPQRELSAGVILAVRPLVGEPWIGVFDPGDYVSRPPAPRQVLAWPDERSVCVVLGGRGSVVRTDDPQIELQIDLWPIRDVLAVPAHGLVVFADHTTLVGYGADGVAWRSGRLAWDGVNLLGVDGNDLRVSGYDAPSGSNPVFTVDVRTGRSTTSPYVGE